jgi:hypothetical protein
MPRARKQEVKESPLEKQVIKEIKWILTNH